MKILIIEDEYSLADAIAETLKKENFTVEIETDGEEGENKALTNVYDLILLDVMLPSKNGFEILKELRKEKNQTPIIMLTAKSEIYDKLNGLENGADDYITKPFHMKELVARVKVKNKKQKALELMKSVGLSEEHSKRKILKLSGGEQQRIAIARSLSYNSKIIIADEPTGNLDKETENDILKIFKSLAKDENKCIIIVTHSQNVCNEVDEVYELASKK